MRRVVSCLEGKDIADSLTICSLHMFLTRGHGTPKGGT
jgi:hypothetical protein